MIKFIIPAIIIFFTVLFWEKINEIIYKKFKIRINYIAILIFSIIIGLILLLLYN
tara:strand:+ start:467 stop:631 length:165 start_codon:yes stop_codon:yes gene_type:complete